ncbi:(2Fe-2S)-binding protein [Amycolatopsis tucumanensis]|uniref:(2Fe-2S)-binding protein n=1 Tax=Amycolatopsis tucumanensis TaxID=401106 RepID=UPI003D736DBF
MDDRSALTITVNGIQHRLTVDPRSMLAETLRDDLGLTGTKRGCDRGECGACTVLVDGRRVLSCLTLSLLADGAEVTTAEGLAPEGELHPVQRAFLENDAFQCGFCTPGQVVSAAACIAEGHAGSEDEIREWMSGNICRCGAYPQIVAAVRKTAAEVVR